MGAVIRSTTLNAGGKILRKSQRSTEVDGLVTLVEAYIIRTSDIADLEPDRNTPHSSFSSATPTYSRMLVETTRVDPLDGDLSELVVTYVGLDYASGLPPAFITTVGQPGAGVFGADAAIVVRYLTADSLFNTLKGSQVTIAAQGTQLALPTKKLLPTTINGTAMPPNPRQREYRRNQTGDVVGLSYYNATTAYALSVAVTGNYGNVAGTVLSTLANALTPGSSKIVIDSVTVNKTNDAFVTVDIAATGYPNLA